MFMSETCCISCNDCPCTEDDDWLVGWLVGWLVIDRLSDLLNVLLHFWV